MTPSLHYYNKNVSTRNLMTYTVFQLHI